MATVTDMALFILMRSSLALADRAIQKLEDKQEIISRWIGVSV